MSDLNPRQQALLELLKVTHAPHRSAVVNLDDARTYLAAIDELAEAVSEKAKPDAKKPKA